MDGWVDGDVSSDALVQGEGSEVHGTIVAESARVAGRIRGAITASALVIQKSARIEGDVTYGTLTIEEGARADGEFTPRVAEAEPLAPVRIADRIQGTQAPAHSRA